MGVPKRLQWRRPQQTLYFRPEPHGHGSFRPVLLDLSPAEAGGLDPAGNGRRLRQKAAIWLTQVGMNSAASAIAWSSASGSSSKTDSKTDSPFSSPHKARMGKWASPLGVEG